MNDLQGRRETYVGRKAAEYEKKRADLFWSKEQATMAHILEGLNCSTVIDVPVGTGRFLPMYEALGMKATGVDLSLDMLAQAQSKGYGELRQGSIFDLGSDVKGVAPVFIGDEFWDLAVCVRFMNWLQRDELVPALHALRRISTRAVVGCGTRTGDVERESFQRIHMLPEWLEAVKEAGWTVLDRMLVEHNERGRFDFWVLA